MSASSAGGRRLEPLNVAAVGAAPGPAGRGCHAAAARTAAPAAAAEHHVALGVVRVDVIVDVVVVAGRHAISGVAAVAAAAQDRGRAEVFLRAR